MAAEDRGPEVTAVIGVFMVFTWIAVLLRCYCRIVIVKSFGLDDYLAVVAVVFFSIWSAFSLRDIYYGTGKHFFAVGSLERYSLGLKWWWLCEPVYTVSSVSLKWSICVYLLRICVFRSQRMAIYGLMILTGIMGLVYFLISILQCWPVSYFWTQILGESGSCLSTSFIVDSVYLYSAVSCFIDWSLAIIPVFLVWNLQMDRNTKIFVAGIISLGGLASTATIARMPYVHTMRDTTDFLYATTDIAIWSMVETGIGIVASAIATLRPFYKRVFLGTDNTNTSLNSRSRSNNMPIPWHKKYSSRQSAGYIRSDRRSGTIENIELKDRNNAMFGGDGQSRVTTVITSDIGRSRKSEDGDLGMGGTWLKEESVDGGDEEIRKTMVVTSSDA